MPLHALCSGAAGEHRARNPEDQNHPISEVRKPEDSVGDTGFNEDPKRAAQQLNRALLGEAAAAPSAGGAGAGLHRIVGALTQRVRHWWCQCRAGERDWAQPCRLGQESRVASCQLSPRLCRAGFELTGATRSFESTPQCSGQGWLVQL